MTTETTKLRDRLRASARVGLTALAAVGALLATAASPAHAWKPKTHVYFAEQALKDAVDNGKVTIYETDYQTGKVIGTLGEFPVEPRILEALKKAPKHFRAGVLGPDAYPDIVTGQKIIHPHASHALDGHAAGGTNSWLTHLWNLSYGPGTQPANSTVPPIIGITMRNDSPAVRAFVVGYITHAAGDMYAHTFMNHFTGGEFMLKPDPRNALKHIVLEGYIGKRTPLTIDTFGTSANNPPESLAAAFPGASFSGLVAEEARRRNALGNVTEMLKIVRQYEDALVTENDISITGLEMYLWKELTWARPGSVLKRQLLEVEERNYSVPYLFSELRNSLQKEVDAYYARSKAGQIAYSATHPGRITFIEHWIKDIDNGLQAWPKLSHELAKEFIFNETHGGADLPAAKKAIDDYVKNYLVYMGPVPDIAVDALKFMASIMDALVPDAIKEAIKDLVVDAVNKIAKAATGRTINEWADYISNPETHFDPIMNGPGGEHAGRTAQRTTLAQVNREHLKIQDVGFTAGTKETFKIDQFPPAFNTVQLCKLLLLGKDGTNQLLDALAAKGLQKPTLPANFENVMLGWLQSLDNDNQWMGLQTKDSLPSATMVFAQNGGATYQKVFMRQVGEENWVTPIASTPTTPNNPPVAGTRPPPPG
ncbi:MAG TPA: hypothetical protein VM490_20160, partial [Armatimonadaceae bacterium]|nr:hypothetical protein [Armatimonadaceae bacterium]